VVIVLGAIDLDPEQREEFVAAQAEEAAACRAESGCVDWLMFPDPDRADVVRLIEVWADTASFEAHLPVLAERQASAAPNPLAAAVRGVQITRHDVVASSPMA
jgi:quinol monooxygenase YgiN